MIAVGTSWPKRAGRAIFQLGSVKENAAGGLNNWLVENEYQTLDDADDVLTVYRDKGYVFACIKVNSESLAETDSVDSPSPSRRDPGHNAPDDAWFGCGTPEPDQREFGVMTSESQHAEPSIR